MKHLKLEVSSTDRSSFWFFSFSDMSNIQYVTSAAEALIRNSLRTGGEFREYFKSFVIKEWIYLHSCLLTWLQQLTVLPINSTTSVESVSFAHGLNVTNTIQTHPSFGHTSVICLTDVGYLLRMMHYPITVWHGHWIKMTSNFIKTRTRPCEAAMEKDELAIRTVLTWSINPVQLASPRKQRTRSNPSVLRALVFLLLTKQLISQYFFNSLIRKSFFNLTHYQENHSLQINV